MTGSAGFRSLRQSAADVESTLGVGLDRVRDDLLGDAVRCPGPQDTAAQIAGRPFRGRARWVGARVPDVVEVFSWRRDDEAHPFVEETQVTAYCLCVSPSEGTPT